MKRDFDPIHPGHTSCIIESKKLGDTLIVVVNDDRFLRVKKGQPFQPMSVRCQIVSCIRGVDYVIPFEAEIGDITVCRALELLKPLLGERDGGLITMRPGATSSFLDDRLAAQGVVFTDYAAAEREYPELLKKILGSAVKAVEDKFAAGTAALAEAGVVLYVPKNIYFHHLNYQKTHDRISFGDITFTLKVFKTL